MGAVLEDPVVVATDFPGFVFSDSPLRERGTELSGRPVRFSVGDLNWPVPALGSVTPGSAALGIATLGSDAPEVAEPVLEEGLVEKMFSSQLDGPNESSNGINSGEIGFIRLDGLPLEFSAMAASGLFVESVEVIPSAFGRCDVVGKRTAPDAISAGKRIGSAGS